MIKDLAVPATATIISLIVVILLHPQLVKLALKKDIVDKPNARRLNRTPIPVLGGIGVFAGFATALIFSATAFSITISYISLIAIAIMLIVGLVDDIRDLKPKTKFLAQIVIITALYFLCDVRIDNFHGTFGIDGITEALSLPLTIFACVGLINSINLIDGIDGLSSGYAIAASLLFLIFGYIQGNATDIVLSSSLIGALIPFFIFNVFGKKNKMFIGDSGSHSLGLIFCIITLGIINSDTTSTDTAISNSTIPFCLAVMAHPVMDTLRVMTMRILNGNPPFKADKTHLHHIIIAAGTTHLATTTIIISLNIAVVAIWYVSYTMGATATIQFFATFFAATIFIVLPYFIIKKHVNKKNTGRIENKEGITIKRETA